MKQPGDEPTPHPAASSSVGVANPSVVPPWRREVQGAAEGPVSTVARSIPVHSAGKGKRGDRKHSCYTDETSEAAIKKELFSIAGFTIFRFLLEDLFL